MQPIFSSSLCQPLLPLQTGSEPSPQGRAEETPVSNERGGEPARHVFSFSWLNSLNEWWLTPAGFWCAPPRDGKRRQPGWNRQRSWPGKGHPSRFRSRELSWPPRRARPLRRQSRDRGGSMGTNCCTSVYLSVFQFLVSKGKAASLQLQDEHCYCFVIHSLFGTSPCRCKCFTDVS